MTIQCHDDADIGRFMQQDPAGKVDGPNMNAYCGNEPVNRPPVFLGRQVYITVSHCITV